jgi:hypothetical protein
MYKCSLPQMKPSHQGPLPQILQAVLPLRIHFFYGRKLFLLWGLRGHRDL